MFDYKGQSVAELKESCDDNLNGCPYPMKYWVSEVYSIGKCLRNITGYPNHLPLCIYTEHGPGHPITEETPYYEIENDAYCMFVSSKEAQKMYQSASNKPCYQYTYPIITYRRKHNIKQDENARGTIVYPSHSIPGLDIKMDFDELCEELNNLPDKYKPICICLHYHDINKNQHEEFIKRGFPVYTAGHPYEPDYIDKFYEILRHFKYSMSNQIGSYLFYSVEMGIPFSVIGKEAISHNTEHKILPIGDYKPTELEGGKYLKYYKLFKDKNRDVITPEQHQFVYEGLGLDSELSSKELRKILDKAYMKVGFKIKDWLFKKIKYKNKRTFVILGVLKFSYTRKKVK